MTDNGKHTLKPCPLCANSVMLEDNTDYHRADSYPEWLIGCDRCNASPAKSIYVSASTRADAIAAWNHRPLEAELVEALQALITAIEFEVPPIMDGEKIERRCRILSECASEAKKDGSPRNRRPVMTQDIEFGPAIDWTKPIEAVRRADGRTIPVSLESSDGTYFYTNLTPDPDETNNVWQVSGKDWCGKDLWFIRNVAQPNPLPADDTVVVKRMTHDMPPVWAIEKARALFEAEMATGVAGHANRAFARYIAQHEEPPVDPMLRRAREIANRAEGDWLEDRGGGAMPDYTGGHYDDHAPVRAALIALREGMGDGA